MAIEADQCETQARRLAFAAGCLWASGKLRGSEELRVSRRELGVGVAVGAAFLAHAFVPDSQSWPWIWPALGGAVSAAAVPARLGWRSPWAPIIAGLKAGLACALLFAAGGLAILCVAAFHVDFPVIARGIVLLAYGALGSIVLGPATAAAATVVRYRLGQ